MEQDFIENELIIVTKATLDKFLKEENPADLIALYIFFYYTAKWQKTNIVKATSVYVKTGLSWGVDRLNKAQNKLIELGLIEKVTRKSKGKIVGWYIKVNYIFSQNTTEIVQITQKPQVDETTSGKQDTNALSTNNINALSTNKEITDTDKEIKESVITTGQLPKTRGNTYIIRLLSIYKDLFNNLYGFYPTVPPQNYGRQLKSIMLYKSELQIALLMIIFFNWAGVSGNSDIDKMKLINAQHPLNWFLKNINPYEVYARNVLNIDVDKEGEVKEFVAKHMLALKE